MPDNYYFDTSIWLDYYEKRGQNGKHALNLIMKIANEDCKIFYSDLNIKELKNIGYSNQEIINLFSIAKTNRVHVHIYREQVEESRNTAKKREVPNSDVLHAILCRDNNLQLISRDVHFEKLKDISEAKKPEEFI